MDQNTRLFGDPDRQQESVAESYFAADTDDQPTVRLSPQAAASAADDQDQQQEGAAGIDDQPTVRLSSEAAANAAHRCSRCGDVLIQSIVGMDVRNGKVVVKRPGIWFGILSGGVSQIDVFVCAGCGYTEFWATMPQELLDGEEEGQASTRLNSDSLNAKTARCEKCGGKTAKVEVGMDVRAGHIVFKHPGSWIGSNRESSIDALCCTICGYTLFYATEPAAMLVDDNEDGNQALVEQHSELSAGAMACVKCGSEINQVTASMANRNGHVVVKRPGTFIGILSGGVSRLRMDSCTECGYTDFYALNPAVLTG